MQQVDEIKGILNLGGTSFANSIVQVLHGINIFRDSVYRLPYNETTLVSDLQKLFYEFSDPKSRSISSWLLTNRLNWSNYEEKDPFQAFLDLFKRIEDDVNENNWNNLVIELFYGRKQLTNSAGEVSTEKFNYISLPIDHVFSIIDSINNQFHTENTSLLTLPSIFVFQLNKLEDTNDYSTALMNNSFFALDLNSYISANKNTGGLNNNENKSESINNIDLNLNDSVDNIYLLHSVIVNSNKLNHNYVYIRPDIELYCNNPMESYLQWYLCDDLLTKTVSESEVIRTVQVDSKDTTKDLACMLVYIKKSRITPTISRLDVIPAELLQKLKEVGKQACEFQEKEKKITDLTLKSTFSSFEFENDIILNQLDAKIIDKVRMKKKFIFPEFQLKEEIEIFCRSFDFSLQSSISTDNDKRNCILNVEAVFDSLFNDLQQKESQYATAVTPVDKQADSNNFPDISNIINDPKMVEQSKLVLAKKKDLELKIEKINLEITTIKSWLNVSQDKQLVLNILNEKKNKLSLIKDKKSELNKLESELRILESQATNSSIALNNLSDYVEDYSDQSRQRNEQLKEQKDQLKYEYAKKNSKMLEQLIQEKENEKKNKEAEINSILSKIVSNQNALNESQNKLLATRQSISETQTSQVNAENELKSLEDRKRTLEASLNQLTSDTVNLTGQIQSLQQKIERTKLVIKARSCQLYDSNGATNAFIQVIRDGNVIDTIGPGRTGRGFNIAVINRNDGSTKAFRSFDTCGDGNAQDRAVEFIQNSFDRNNNILVAISVDEMSNCLNRARTTLRNNYGMDPPNQWRQAWFFIKDGNSEPNQAKGRDVNNSNRESRGYYIDSPDLEIPGYRVPIVEQCNAGIRELQNQINQKNEQIANGKTELSGLSSLFDANNVTRTNLRSELEKLNISLNDINDGIKKLEANIQQQNNEKDILTSQQQKIQETIEKYNKEKETVSTRTDSSIGNDAWKLNIVNLHTDITNKQASISTLINDNLQSLKAKIQETESSARKMTIDSNISTTSLLLQNNFWMKLISWLQRDLKMENEWLSYLTMSSPSEESNRNLPSSEDLSNQILQNNKIFVVQVTSRTDIIEKQYAMFQDQNNNKLTEDQMFQLNLNYVSQLKDLEDEFILVKEFFDKENAIKDLQMKINDFREVIINEESKLEIFEIDQSEFISNLTVILEKQETIDDVSSNSYTRVINQEIDRLFLVLNETQKNFNSITNEENLPLEEALDKNLLILCGFDSLTNGKPLTSEESLICLLISNVFDYQNIYNQEKLNVMMNLEAESQLQKLLDKYQAYHYDTVNIQTIIDLVNEEYEDENIQFIIEINGNIYQSNSYSQDSMNKIHLYCYQNIHGLYFSVHHLLDYSFDKEDPLNDIVLKYEYLYSKVQHKVDYSYLNTLFQGKYQDVLKNLSNNTMLNTFYQNQVMKIQKLSSVIEVREDIFNDKENENEKENDKETLFIQLTELNTLQTFIFSHKNSFNVEDFYQIDLENKKKLNDLKQAYSDYFHRLTEEEIKNRNLQNKMNDLMNQLKQEELIYNSAQLKLKQQIAMKENLLHEKETFLHQLQLVKDNNDEKYLVNEKQLKEEIEQLKTDLSTLNNQITDSKAHQVELKTTIANLSSTISEDKENIKLNEDKIKEIEGDLEKKRSERRNIQYNIADIDGDITIANKRKDVASKELDNEIIKMKYSLIWMAFINILKDICTKDEIFMKRNEILSALTKPGYLLKDIIDLIGSSEGISSDISKFIEKKTSNGDPTYNFIQDLQPLDIKDKFDFMVNEIDHPKFDSFIMTIEPNGKEKVKTIMKPALGIMDLTYEKKQQRNGRNEPIQKIVINGVNLSMEDIMLAIQNNILEKMNSAGILKYTFQDGYLFVGSSFVKSLKETFNEIDNKCQSNLSTLIKSRVNIRYRESQRETIMNAVDKAYDALPMLHITIMDVVRMFFIQEIEIISTGKVFVDQSETNLYGTNLTIVANDLHFGSHSNNSLNGMVYLHVEGRNGEAFAEDQAENGVNAILPEKGGAGANGIAGDHGQHAGNINIKITNGITGLGNLGAIDVSGGNARAGQLGGNGGKGGDGKQGKAGEKRDIDSDYIQSIVTKAKPTIEPGLGGDAGRDAEDGKIGTFGFITIIANDFELSFGEKRVFKGNHSFILSDGTVWNAEQRIISNDGKVWHPVNDKEEPITKTKRGGDAGVAKSDALDKCCSREPASKISYWKHGRSKWTSGLIEHNGYFFDRIKSSYEKNNIQYLKQLTGWNYHIQDCGYYTPSTSDCKDKNKVHIDNDEEISTERTEGGLVQGPAGLVHHGWYFIPDHASQEDMNESQRRNQERINQRNTVTLQEYEKLNSSIKMTNQVQQQEQNQVSDISTSVSKLNASTIVNENAIGNDSYKLFIDQMKVNQENLQSTITENDSKIKIAQEKKQNYENELQALNQEITAKENELQEYEKATESIKEKVYANEEERNQAQQALHDEMNRLNDLQYANAVKEAEKSLNEKDVTKGQQYHNDKSNEISKASEKTKNEIENDKKDLNQLLDEINQLSDKKSKISSDINERNSNSSSLNENESVKRVNLEKTNARFQQEEEVRNEIRANMAGGQSNQAKNINNLLDINLFYGVDINYRAQLIEFIDQLTARQFLRLETNLLLQLSTTENLNYYENEQLISNFKNVFQLYFTPDHVNHMMLILCLMNKREKFMVSINQFLQIMKFKQLIQLQYEEKENDILFKCKFNAMYASINGFISSSSNKKQCYDAQDILDLFQSLFQNFIGLKDTIIVGQKDAKKRSQFQFLYGLLLEKYGLQLVCQSIKVKLFTCQDDLLINEESQKKLNSLQLIENSFPSISIHPKLVKSLFLLNDLHNEISLETIQPLLSLTSDKEFDEFNKSLAYSSSSAVEPSSSATIIDVVTDNKITFSYEILLNKVLLTFPTISKELKTNLTYSVLQSIQNIYLKYSYEENREIQISYLDNHIQYLRNSLLDQFYSEELSKEVEENNKALSNNDNGKAKEMKENYDQLINAMKDYGCGYSLLRGHYDAINERFQEQLNTKTPFKVTNDDIRIILTSQQREIIWTDDRIQSFITLLQTIDIEVYDQPITNTDSFDRIYRTLLSINYIKGFQDFLIIKGSISLTLKRIKEIAIQDIKYGSDAQIVKDQIIALKTAFEGLLTEEDESNDEVITPIITSIDCILQEIHLEEETAKFFKMIKETNNKLSDIIPLVNNFDGFSSLNDTNLLIEIINVLHSATKNELASITIEDLSQFLKFLDYSKVNYLSLDWNAIEKEIKNTETFKERLSAPIQSNSFIMNLIQQRINNLQNLTLIKLFDEISYKSKFFPDEMRNVIQSCEEIILQRRFLEFNFETREGFVVSIYEDVVRPYSKLASDEDRRNKAKMLKEIQQTIETSQLNYFYEKNSLGSASIVDLINNYLNYCLMNLLNETDSSIYYKQLEYFLLSSDQRITTTIPLNELLSTKVVGNDPVTSEAVPNPMADDDNYEALVKNANSLAQLLVTYVDNVFNKEISSIFHDFRESRFHYQHVLNQIKDSIMTKYKKLINYVNDQESNSKALYLSILFERLFTLQSMKQTNNNNKKKEIISYFKDLSLAIDEMDYSKNVLDKFIDEINRNSLFNVNQEKIKQFILILQPIFHDDQVKNNYQDKSFPCETVNQCLDIFIIIKNILLTNTDEGTPIIVTNESNLSIDLFTNFISVIQYTIFSKEKENNEDIIDLLYDLRIGFDLFEGAQGINKDLKRGIMEIKDLLTEQMILLDYSNSSNVNSLGNMNDYYEYTRQEQEMKMKESHKLLLTNQLLNPFLINDTPEKKSDPIDQPKPIDADDEERENGDGNDVQDEVVDDNTVDNLTNEVLTANSNFITFVTETQLYDDNQIQLLSSNLEITSYISLENDSITEYYELLLILEDEYFTQQYYNGGTNAFNTILKIIEHFKEFYNVQMVSEIISRYSGELHLISYLLLAKLNDIFQTIINDTSSSSASSSSTETLASSKRVIIKLNEKFLKLSLKIQEDIDANLLKPEEIQSMNKLFEFFTQQLQIRLENDNQMELNLITQILSLLIKTFSYKKKSIIENQLLSNTNLYDWPIILTKEHYRMQLMSLQCTNKLKEKIVDELTILTEKDKELTRNIIELIANSFTKPKQPTAEGEAATLTEEEETIQKDLHQKIGFALLQIIENFISGLFIFDKITFYLLKDNNNDSTTTENSHGSDYLLKWYEIIEKDSNERRKSKDRSLEELVELMAEPNKIQESYAINNSIQGIILENKQGVRPILELFKQVKVCYQDKIKEEWTKDDIKEYAKTLLGKQREEAFDWNGSILPKLIATIKKAAKLCFGDPPLDTQLIALVVYLDGASRGKQGRLGNIGTGEGKTHIAAFLAVCLCLLGEKVDIVTSSKVLAYRETQNKELMEFYQCFGLIADNNCDEDAELFGEVGKEIRRKRYQKANIMYGDTGSFQRDILLTRFFGDKIRLDAGTDQGIAGITNNVANNLILDEVDSMLLDNSSKTLYISHNIIDLRWLRDVFVHIWNMIHAPDAQDGSYQAMELVEKAILQLINDKTITLPEESTQSTIIKYVHQNLKTWIKNAYYANRLEEDNHYIIGDKESSKYGHVIPIAKDTGIEQLNTNWNNGLTQFIQLKHSLELTDETLKAVFISSIKYFQMYPFINGMTGTIGGEKERNLLKRVYNLEFFEVPRLTSFSFIQEKGIVCGTKGEFLNTISYEINKKCCLFDDTNNMDVNRKEIIEKETKKINKKIKEFDEITKKKQEFTDNLTNLKHKTNRTTEEDSAIKKLETELKNITEEFNRQNEDKGKNEHNYDQLTKEGVMKDIRRSVLVICDSINDVDDIKATLQSSLSNYNKLIIYDRAYNGLKNEDKLLNPGDIVIATNIAGRGTSFKTSSLLEINGGLHVIVAYVPANLRIEDQAFGRTCRKGKKGSGQFIVYDYRKENDVNLSINYLKNERDRKEIENLEEMEYRELKSIQLEGDLFDKFNLFNQKMDLQLKNQYHSSSKEIYQLQLANLRNHWAFWLCYHEEDMKQSFNNEKKQFMYQKYQKFEDSIRQKVMNPQQYPFSLIEEPVELTKLGYLYYKKGKHDKAQEVFSYIIQKYPSLSAQAHYYQAMSIIDGGNGGKDNRISCKNELKQSCKLLNEERSRISNRQQIIQNLYKIYQKTSRKGGTPDLFSLTLEEESNILLQHISAIQNQMGSIFTEDGLKSGLIYGDKLYFLFHSLVKKNEIIKDYRLSKKCIINKDNKTISYPNNSTKIDIPEDYHYCQDQILSKLLDLSGATKTYQQRKIPKDFFKEIVFSLDVLNDIILTSKKIQKIKIFKLINNSSFLEKKLDDPFFQGKGKFIKELLKGKSTILTTSGAADAVAAGGKECYFVTDDNFIDSNKQIARLKQSDFENYLRAILSITNENDIQEIIKALGPQDMIKCPSSIQNPSTQILDDEQKMIDVKHIFEKYVNKEVAKQILFKELKDLVPKDSDKLRFINEFQCEVIQKNGILEIEEEYCWTGTEKEIENFYQTIKLSTNQMTIEGIDGKIDQLHLDEITKDPQIQLHLKELIKNRLHNHQNLIEQRDFIQLFSSSPTTSAISEDELEYKYDLVRELLKNNQFIEKSFFEELELTPLTNEQIHFQQLIEDYLTLFMKCKGHLPLNKNLNLGNKQEESEKLWNYFFDSQIIKDRVIHLKIVSNPPMDKIEKKIQKEVKDIFHEEVNQEEWHDWINPFEDLTKKDDSKAKSYVNDIVEHIKNLAGTLKIYKKVKVEYKSIEEFFQEDNIPPAIIDYAAMLFVEAIYLVEKKDGWKWSWDAFWCTMIGLGQICLGVALAVATFGGSAQLSEMLISEGIGDMVFAIQAQINGDFTWKAYVQHKILSLAITVLTMGVGTLLSKAGTTAGKTAAEVATEVAAKRASKLALTATLLGKIGLNVVKVGIEIGINQAADAASDAIMDELISDKLDSELKKIGQSDEANQKRKEIIRLLKLLYQQYPNGQAMAIFNQCVDDCFMQVQQGDLSNKIMNHIETISSIFDDAKRYKGKAALVMRFMQAAIQSAIVIKAIVDISQLYIEIFIRLINQLKEKTSSSSSSSSSTNNVVDDADTSHDEEINKAIKDLDDKIVKEIKSETKSKLLNRTIRLGLNKLNQKTTGKIIDKGMKSLDGVIESHQKYRGEELIANIDDQSKQLTHSNYRLLIKTGLLNEEDSSSIKKNIGKIDANGQEVISFKNYNKDQVKKISESELHSAKVFAMKGNYYLLPESGLRLSINKYLNLAYKTHVKEVTEGKKGASDLELNVMHQTMAIPKPLQVIKDDEVPQGEGIIVKIRSDKEENRNHFIPILGHEEVDINLLSNDINASDKKCGARAVLLAGKYDEFKNKGQSHEMAKENAMKYVLKEENMKKFMLNYKKTALKTKVTRDLFEQGEYRNRQDWIGEGRSLATKAMRDVPLRATQCHKLAQKDTKESLLENGKDRNITSAIDRHEKLRAPAYDEMEKMVTKLFNAKTFPLIPDDVLKQVTVRKAASYQNERGWKDATRKAQSLREAEVDLLLKKKPKTLLKDCTNVHAAHRFAPTVNVSRVVTWVRKELNNTTSATKTAQLQQIREHCFKIIEHQSRTDLVPSGYNLSTFERQTDTDQFIDIYAHLKGIKKSRGI